MKKTLSGDSKFWLKVSYILFVNCGDEEPGPWNKNLILISALSLTVVTTTSRHLTLVLCYFFSSHPALSLPASHCNRIHSAVFTSLTSVSTGLWKAEPFPSQVLERGCLNLSLHSSHLNPCECGTIWPQFPPWKNGRD